MSFADRRAHPASARRTSPARDRLVSGAATAIGSLPHLDPVEAAALAVAVHPSMPAAPQLPARHRAEGMLAQVAGDVPGVGWTPDGTLRVDLTVLDPGDPGSADLAGDGWAGLRAFLSVAGPARPPLVKVQLAGPVTLARALVEAGTPHGVAAAVSSAAVQAKVRAVLGATHEAVPDAGLVLVLDEPALVTLAGETSGPFSRTAVVDLLSGAIGAAGPDVAVGVHCCGPADWPAVTAAGPDILAAPLDAGLTAEGSGLAGFLERGGWVAWGVVPTHRPLGDDAEGLTRRLLDAWCDAGRTRCDGFRLWRQALVTPDCGLAGFGVSQAERALRLAARVSDRLRDQAVAARLALGA